MEEAFAHKSDESSRNGGKNGKTLVPPDGGWGYVVCVGVGLVFMLGFGSTSAFGILFKEFFEKDGGASGLTLVIGVYNGALSLFGFLSGIALKRFSYRQIGIIGAVLFIAGDIGTIFVEKTYQLVITFGLIRGAGFGMTIPVSYTAFNNYFLHKRTAMMSANQSMSSLASITFPILITFLLSLYGFRATLALVFAIDLHMLVAMIVMQPVNWHLVAVADENKKNMDDSSVDVKITVTQKNIGAVNERETHCDDKMSVVNTLKNVWRKVLEEVDFELLRKRNFLCTLIGLSFAFVSDVTYLALEPMLLFSYGFSNYQVAFCVMLGASSDFLARVLLAIYTYFIVVDSTALFVGGIAVTMFLRIALVVYSEYWYVCVVTVLSGCVRCTVQVLFPLVLGKVAPNNFTGALALHIVFSGFLMMIADPIVGIIYDATGSYLYPFLAMSVCCFICLALMFYDKYAPTKRNSIVKCNN